jgi:hypothetical protein
MKIIPFLKEKIKLILPKPSIVMDNMLGHRNEIIYLQKLVRDKKWLILEIKLSEADKASLPLYISYLTSTSVENLALLTLWLEKHPNSIYPYLVNAGYYTQWAWDTRGRGLGMRISPINDELFIERLHQAYMLLQDALELVPDTIEAYHQMVILAMVHPYIDKEKIHQRMNEIDETHFSAQSSIISTLSTRWGAKENKALEYVYALCNDRPKGDTLHGLIAILHIEEWVGLNNTGFTTAYFLSKNVQYDIWSAYQQCFPNEVFREDIDALKALNAFAFCFYLSRRKETVKKILRYLNGRSSTLPWEYLQHTFFAFIDVNYRYSRVHKELGILKLK